MSRAHRFAKFFESGKTLTKKPDVETPVKPAAVVRAAIPAAVTPVAANGIHALMQAAQAARAARAAQASLQASAQVEPESGLTSGSAVVWRPAQVYAGTKLVTFTKYLVSNTGQIRHKNKTKVRKTFTRFGFECVALRRDGAVSNLDHRVHLLVASTFKLEERTATKTCCVHVDNNRANNTVANLKWVDKQEAATVWGARRKRKKPTSYDKPVFRRKKHGTVESFINNSVAAKHLAYETGDTFWSCKAQVSRYATLGCTVDGNAWSFIDPTTLPEEKWKRVASCYAKSGTYLVSSHGRVFQRSSKKIAHPVDLIRRPNKTVAVSLQASEKMNAPTEYVEHEVGKLVYTAFNNDHAPLPVGAVVVHLDNNRLNNSAGNVTIKKSHRAKKVECTWTDGQSRVFSSAIAAARSLGVTAATVYQRIRTATATSKGVMIKRAE